MNYWFMLENSVTKYDVPVFSILVIDSWWESTTTGTQIFKSTHDQHILSLSADLHGKGSHSESSLGEYGIRVRGCRKALVALACKVTWGYHLVAVKLLLGSPGHQRPLVCSPRSPQSPFTLGLTRVACSLL